MNAMGLPLERRQACDGYWACQEAEKVTAGLAAQRDAWSKGFTRRRLLAGSGLVLAASLGTQLVTTRHSYAAAGNGKTLVVVFLRGGLDGLATVVPRNDPYLPQLRGSLAIPDSRLLPLNSTFGLHPAMQPMHSMWNSGSLAFVHAVGAPESNRDHFASQALIERGTTNLMSPTGWLDRVLEQDGPGTTFRAVCEGPTTVEALKSTRDAVAMRGVDSLTFSNTSTKIDDALRTLYTGLDHDIGALMEHTLTAVAESGPLKSTPGNPQNGAVYGTDGFGDAMADVARLVRSNCGLRVATIDVGGWDVHSEAGSVDAGTMTSHLANAATTLGAFNRDLGSRMSDVTVVVLSEFGRRAEQNGTGGTDHGFGGLMMLFGGSVKGGQMHGGWPGLAPTQLTGQGDVEIVNDYRDVLGDVAQRTLNLGSMQLFPGYTVRKIGSGLLR